MVQGSRVQKFKGSRVQKFNGSKVQGFKGSRVPRVPRVPRFQSSKVQRNAKLRQALTAVAPAAAVAVVQLLVAVPRAHATATWIGTNGSWNSASNSARTSGNWVRAASDARKARQWMPWSPAPWSALGLAQLGSGLAPEARASFHKALSIDSGDWKLWYDLARASSGRARMRALGNAVALFPRSGLKVEAQAKRRKPGP